MTPTLCSECDNVAVNSRKDQPRYWQCVKHKRLPGFSFVTAGEWVNFPPYLHCSAVNGGACPFFTPLRSPASERAAAGADEHDAQ
jgi:hypothetical protein